VCCVRLFVIFLSSALVPRMIGLSLSISAPVNACLSDAAPALSLLSLVVAVRTVVRLLPGASARGRALFAGSAGFPTSQTPSASNCRGRIREGSRLLLRVEPVLFQLDENHDLASVLPSCGQNCRPPTAELHVWKYAPISR
jgi:hypothetical protein